MVLGPILLDADLDSVRAAIDTTLTPATLPNAVIQMPIYAGAAETAIRTYDPNVASYALSSLEWARTKQAAILLTAALVVRAVPNFIHETAQDYSIRTQPRDLAAMQADLRDRAEIALAGNIAANAIPTIGLSVFARASSGHPSLINRPHQLVGGLSRLF